MTEDFPPKPCCAKCWEPRPLEYCRRCHRDQRKCLIDLEEDNWNSGILILRLRRQVRRVIRLWRVEKERAPHQQ